MTDEERYLDYGAADRDSASAQSIARFVESWQTRARVRKRWAWEPALRREAPDFLEDLLPFREHPAFSSGAEKTRAACLSAGWLVYNYKTIAIETQIIIPACNDLLAFSINRKLSISEAGALAATITDEGFHTLLSTELCRMTSMFRGITIRVPEFDLTRQLRKHQASGDRAFCLVRLAYAAVSEVFISDYLSLISSSQVIQPLFREAVALHKADEMGHRRLFPLLIRYVIKDFGVTERSLFVEALREAVKAFASRETRAWGKVLSQIYTSQAGHGGEMTPVCTEAEGKGDFSGLADLISDLGLDDASSQIRDAS